MMCKFNSKFKNGTDSLGDIVDGSTETKHLMKTERDENLRGNCDIEDEQTGRCLSCASSLGNDSGFGSDTDDHVIDGLLNVSCDFCSENKKLKIDPFIDRGGNNSVTICGHDCGMNKDDKIKTKSDCCVDGSAKGNKANCDSEGTKVMKVMFRGGDINQINCDDLDSEVMFGGGDINQIINEADISNTIYSFTNVQLTNHAESKIFELRKDPTDSLCLDSVSLYRGDVGIDSGVVCDKDISIETQTDTTTREKADSVNSAAIHENSCQLRTVRRRRRRCRVQDVNNNSARARNLTSFLRRMPLTFNHCFQEQGLLLLVACIIYTLILMVIISLMCIIIETFKCAIGTKNLKKIRKQIHRYRHTRMRVAG